MKSRPFLSHALKDFYSNFSCNNVCRKSLFKHAHYLWFLWVFFHSLSSCSVVYKQCVRPIFKYGIVSTITVSESVINKIQRVQNSFIRLALRLSKYVSARLIPEASGLPYVRERLITVGYKHLARMHANPLVEHTINSAVTNIA